MLKRISFSWGQDFSIRAQTSATEENASGCGAAMGPEVDANAGVTTGGLTGFSCASSEELHMSTNAIDGSIS